MYLTFYLGMFVWKRAAPIEGAKRAEEVQVHSLDLNYTVPPRPDTS